MYSPSSDESARGEAEQSDVTEDVALLVSVGACDECAALMPVDVGTGDALGTVEVGKAGAARPPGDAGVIVEWVCAGANSCTRVLRLLSSGIVDDNNSVAISS